MTPARTLSPTEVDIIGDADQELIDTAQIFGTSAATNENLIQDVFDNALRIKYTLDAFEEKAATEPSTRALAVLMNGEHLLMQLYKGTPLRYNPFLSHWVEAVQRLDALNIERQSVTIGSKVLSKEAIIVARTLWIKTLLSRQSDEKFTTDTPTTIANTLIRDGLRTSFRLKPFIQLLEEEGIYEAYGDEPGDVDANRRSDKNNAQPSFQEWKATLPQKLRDEPEQAVFELTRLPIELSYLDYLTTLLNHHTLEEYSIDPAPVVTQYIQHALRTVERMEKPPSGTRDSLEDDHAGFLIEPDQDLEYGKEAQSRAVKLLLLFIKSLIRKGLVGADVLYFEIQEICVRYVWIKEVREFRVWVEEGVSGDGAS